MTCPGCHGALWLKPSGETEMRALLERGRLDADDGDHDPEPEESRIPPSSEGA